MTFSYTSCHLNKFVFSKSKKQYFFNFSDIITFVIPASVFIEIDFIGRIFFSDIICVFLLPCLIWKQSKILNNSYVRMFVILGTSYLLGQVIADIVQQSEFYDYSRGWAKIAMTIVNFCTITMLINTRRSRVLTFSWGVVIGFILQYFVNPLTYASWEPWKFGLGAPITWAIVLITTLFNNNSLLKLIIKYLLVFAAGALNLYFGFRSLGGICLLTLSYLLLQNSLYTKKAFSKKVENIRISLFLIGLVIASITVVQLYSYTARKGWLGDEQAQKYEAQSHGIFGLIIGGRSEIMVSTIAILNSPWIGHGSWAKDSDYAELLIYLKHKYGYDNGTSNESGLIPSHSHFFGGWVEAGILGAIFWGWLFFLAIRAVVLLFLKTDPHASFLTFIIFLLFWDILFSPYGASGRILIPFYAVVMIEIFARHSRTSKSFKYANFYRHHFI